MKTGHFDVTDAWRSLTIKGMAPVLCQMAHFNEKGQLHLTEQNLRLCG